MKNVLEYVLRKSVEEVVEGIPRPFGLLLSGGVDSGLLAAWTKPDIVYTARFDGELFDEFKYSQMVVKHLGLKQKVIHIKKRDFKKYLKPAVNAFRPTYHFSLVPLYMLFERANKDGMTNILSGEGPDEYLGGYTAYSVFLQEKKLIDKLKGADEFQNYQSMLDKHFGTDTERYARLVNQSPRSVEQYWDKYENTVSKMGYADLALRGIEDMEEALAAHHGVNLIYPYMTPEVERFCFEDVPDVMKVFKNTTKITFKAIASKYLPEEVVWRKNKMGGPVAPVNSWIGVDDPFDKTEYLKLQEEIWNHSAQ